MQGHGVAVAEAPGEQGVKGELTEQILFTTAEPS